MVLPEPLSEPTGVVGGPSAGIGGPIRLLQEAERPTDGPAVVGDRSREAAPLALGIVPSLDDAPGIPHGRPSAGGVLGVTLPPEGGT
jgi:hypothetical protein